MMQNLPINAWGVEFGSDIDIPRRAYEIVLEDHVLAVEALDNFEADIDAARIKGVHESRIRYGPIRGMAKDYYPYGTMRGLREKKLREQKKKQNG
jgi:hypothetical protein